MRLVLDTHSFLWFIEGDERLSRHARSLIEDLENEVVLSMSSLWEIVIKAGLGKLSLARPFEDLIPEQLERNQIQILGIEMHHLIALARLPMHHRDPFDRLLIAQAMADGLPIVGRDSEFKEYGVQMVW